MTEFTLDWIPMLVTLVFIIFDYVTGVIKAIVHKNMDSSIMRVGLWHKFSYILIVALAVACEVGMNFINLGLDLPLIIPVCTYICVTEILSIIENICEINPNLKGAPIFSIFTKVKKWDD